MTRQEVIELRKRLIVGEPPYTKDTTGNLVRDRGGFAGIEERRIMGDYSPDATAIRVLIETCLLLIDDKLERMRP